MKRTMNDTLYMLLVFTGGLLLGALFFGGLWLTVRKTVAAKQPALWIAGSLFLRTGIALAGFYYIGHSDWQRLLSCLVGFITARLIIIRLTRPNGRPGLILKKEASHEA
jgi:F1F0 ATPase subunit 2